MLNKQEVKQLESIMQETERSKLKTFFAALLNLITRIIELFNQISYIELEDFPTFILLQILPVILGVILIFAVFQNHYGGCMFWSLGETAIIFGHIAILCYKNSALRSWTYIDLLMYFYCATRVVIIYLIVQDFMEHLDDLNISKAKIDQVLLRNDFWHQLSLLHRENEVKLLESS